MVRLDDDLDALAAAMTAAGVVGWDTETWRTAPGRLAPPMVCASFAWRRPGGKMRSTLVDRPTAVELLHRLLVDDGPLLIAHNAAFDLGVAWATDGYEQDLADLEAMITYRDAGFDVREALSKVRNGPRREQLAPKVWQALDDDRATCSAVREALLLVASGEANRRGGVVPSVSLAASVDRRLAEHVTGKVGEDAWRLRYHELDGVPIVDWPNEARRYAEDDARLCLRLYEAQSTAADDLVGSPEIPDEAPQVRAAFALHLTAAWGIRADVDRVEAYSAELEGRKAKAGKILERAGLLVDGTLKRAPKQAAVVERFEREGLPLPLTDKGEELLRVPGTQLADLVPKYVSTAKDHLSTVPCHDPPCDVDGRYTIEPCGELLHVLAWYSEAALEASRYVEAVRRATTEVVNPRITSVLATGRCSASKPPYQQLPRRPGARECIVPRPGYVFVGADYSAAELVTLAQVLVEVVGSSALADTLRAGYDPHLRTGAAILGIEYAEAERRKRAGDREVKDARQLAKALNFGLPGGLGPDTFVSYAWGTWGVRLTRDRAAELKSLWLSLYPEVREYFGVVSARCDAGGGSFDLRQPYSGRLRGSVRYCDGCNSSFQGLAADAAKAALYRVCSESWRPELRSPLLGSRPSLFVHDEIITEAREARAPEAAERLAVVMVEELAERCPDLVEACKADPWVARRWSKACEPMRDEAGRLVPWDDGG